MFVHGQTFDPQAERRRRYLDAGPTQRFGDDQVARFGQGHQRRLGRGLCPRRDQDVFGAGIHTQAGQPFRACLEMRSQAVVRLIAGNRFPDRFVVDAGDGALGQGADTDGHGIVGGKLKPFRAHEVRAVHGVVRGGDQIDAVAQRVDVIVQRRRRDTVGGGGDEGAAPDLAAGQAAAFQFLVGAGHGAQRHAQVIGQIALRRQFGARRQVARFQSVDDGIDDRLVLGAGTAAQLGHPDCHGAILRIVSIVCQLY